MKLFKKEKSFLGLDIGKFSIKIVELAQDKEGLTLKNLAISNLSFETIVDEMIIDTNEIINRIKTLLKFYKITTKDVTIAIPGNSIIIKRVTVSGETYDDIKREVEAEAINNIPYNINEVEIAFHVFEQEEEDSDKNEVLLIAIKKEILEDYITILIEAGLKPEIADVDFFALQNIFEYNYKDDIEPEEIIVLLNIGANICNIIALKNFKSLFYRDTNIGNLSQYIRTQNLLNIPFEEIEKMKLENSGNIHVKKLMDLILKNILSDFSKGIDLFLNSYGFDKIDKIFLSGGGSMRKGLKETIQERYPDTTVEHLDPFKKITINDKNFDKDYINYIKPQFSIATGLALRGFND